MNHVPDRLHPRTLEALPKTVARYAYPREKLKTGIVHLGLGAFVRAHMAAINEVTLHAHFDLRWGIVGVSLRQPDTRDALLEQDGLYTLSLRHTSASGEARQQLQVIGCLSQVLVAPEDPGKVIRLIAAVDTRIVSLTVTEKGYCHNPAQGTLQWEHPDIVHDLDHTQTPRSAIGFIVRGLQQRYLTHGLPLTLMSLDNLPSNGHVLSRLVLDFAQKIDPALAQWIEARCTFPNSMVDRIVPRTTEADRTNIDATLGLRDAWPVITETFNQWIIEDKFVRERPAWALGGAQFVESAAAWETLKLRMVNGTHSAIAYLGSLAGWLTVDQAMSQPELVAFLDALMCEEIEPTLPELPSLDLAAYRQSLLVRFTNRALAHRTQQIAMDGSQKIPQRWLNTIRYCQTHQRLYPKLALGLAAWIQYLGGTDALGNKYKIQDPLANVLQTTLRHAEAAVLKGTDQTPTHLARQQVQALIGLQQIFSDLKDDTDLITAVAQQLVSLRTQGVVQTLSTHLSR